MERDLTFIDLTRGERSRRHELRRYQCQELNKSLPLGGNGICQVMKIDITKLLCIHVYMYMYVHVFEITGLSVCAMTLHIWRVSKTLLKRQIYYTPEIGFVALKINSLFNK